MFVAINNVLLICVDFELWSVDPKCIYFSATCFSILYISIFMFEPALTCTLNFVLSSHHSLSFALSHP